MSARRSIGSVSRLGPDRYRVQVEIGRDPVSGERRRLSRNVRGTRAEAERELARLTLEAGAAPSSTVTLRAYVETAWIPRTAERVRRRTVDDYALKMKSHVLPKLGDVRLGDLQPYQLDRFFGELAAGDLSPRSRLHVYRVLHNALGQAVKWRLIPTNPLDAVERPRVEQSEPDVLSAAEANAYLDAFAGHVLEPFVIVAIAAGLRRSELAALSWSDVDLKAGTVSVERGLHESGGEVWAEKPKTTRSRRVVTLPGWAVARLKAIRGVGPLALEGGAAIRPTRITVLYRRHVAAAGLRYVPLKNLRHTAATLALAAGVSPVTLSRRLGHSTFATTDSFYLKITRDADELAAEQLEGFREARGI